MDWDKLRVFHAVALAGSFTHAGEDLNLSQSAVSRQISALEEELGVQLFHRHARGLESTEHGDLLYRAAHDVFDKLAAVRARLTDSKNIPAGDLRITTTVGLGSTWLTPRTHDFLKLYPDIRLSIICDDGELDLGMREADVAIRITEPRQPDLIKKRLFTVQSHLYASPKYLARHGTPHSIDDLDDCPLIAYGDHAPTTLRNINWPCTVGLKPHGRPRSTILQVNNIYGLLLAIESGVGIGALPDYMITPDRPLQRILPEVDGPSTDAFFVYPEEMRNTKRISVFREFLEEQVRQWQF
ncbi:MAG: LysR family transcriptional regulator [Alphaproteobacteria bacterium]|jgi:DNA-binding transcriptional LysR family regulator|nr:LysR family transcriptional regulator [Rhodospirillaceae bacterium]MDP6021513.1 LysR family transcriptional regulator [Alphaproteobacteria bacterium]MDP6253845.1 LysR family transcriptional regulator [Alphaproteobacteria bacterium]MDP7056384.1 LysR family transcriptional regulator [Alphaproteobacteria bacterium]MDP7228420.1 LysR family transcriptional regulator [Alphaproteobacteria bacterium]|tara:strand:+ start:5431 stop:6324 length:894 start_codon:yes stop_codon:yes gene_type:complete